MAVASLAVLIGTSESVSAVPTMEQLAARFDPAGTSKSASKFDPAELTVLNRVLIHHLPFDEAKDRLLAFGVPEDKAEAFWLAVRGNLDVVADAARWWRIVSVGPDGCRNCRTRIAASCATPMTSCRWNRGTATPGRSGPTASRRRPAARAGRLYMPLRLALTGLASGPELSDLLPLLGREGTLARRP